MKNKCYSLSVDECAALDYIQKNRNASFDAITLYIGLYRDKIEKLMEGLVSKRLVRPVKIEDYECEVHYDLEDHQFSKGKTKTKKITIKKQFLWRLRFFFLRILRKAQRAISIRNDLRKMEKDKWKRIKAAGLEKEYKEKERWAKHLLKTNDIGLIDLAIQKSGYKYDRKHIFDHLLLNDVLYNSIGIIVKHRDYSIETISGLTVLSGKECLNFVTPYNAAFHYVK